MIDVGASAGLHLLWDQYGYDYGINRVYGDPTSEVVIESELKGGFLPPLDHPLPRAQSRFGIELRIISVDNKDDMMWLDALIWPEHR